MTLHAYLLTSASHPAMRCVMTPATAAFYANALALSYRGLGLRHLDLTPVGPAH